MRWWLKILPDRFFPLWQGQILALACVLGAAFLRLALEPVLGRNAPFAIFFPALLIASVWGGPAAGFTVLVLSTLIVATVWLPLHWSWALPASTPLLLLAFAISGGLLIAIAALLRALVSAHQMAEERATILAQEMQHRVRNLLALVGTISSQTARGAPTVAAHQALFTARLHALARVQSLFQHCPQRPTTLRALLEEVLEPFGTERFGMAGPAVILAEEISFPLALLLHELATNAMKHGALSVPGGRVELAWTEEQRRVAMEWREVGGPPVEEPPTAGFGSRLIRTAFPSEIGEVEMTFAPDGVRCVMRFYAGLLNGHPRT